MSSVKIVYDVDSSYKQNGEEVLFNTEEEKALSRFEIQNSLNIVFLYYAFLKIANKQIKGITVDSLY